MLSKIIDANDWVQRSTVVDKIPLTDVSISQHLRKLRVMGFVESRNVGNTTEYRIAPAAQACGQLFKDILKAASKQIDHLTRTTLLRQLQLSSPKETEE
jgi:DNA-binding transcriptional ArsR family regulator